MNLRIKRIYEAASPADGDRFLVDRLWPRGVKKEALTFAAWLKDVAPSDTPRRWFGHDPARWTTFRRRYRAELKSHPAALQPLRDALARGFVTLLYSARDEAHNQAVVLPSSSWKHRPHPERPETDPPELMHTNPHHHGLSPRCGKTLSHEFPNYFGLHVNRLISLK
ncbi:MAG: DUF488 domain-containing protein [Limisphaerales bacterium]